MYTKNFAIIRLSSSLEIYSKGVFFDNTWHELVPTSWIVVFPLFQRFDFFDEQSLDLEFNGAEFQNWSFYYR